MPGYYIILPIAHGKSWNHDPVKGIWEADQTYNWRADPELKAMRDKAKATGDWAKFDFSWGYELRKLVPSNQILLVPHEHVALTADRNFLIGTYVLKEEVWLSNMGKRDENVAEWRAHYERVRDEFCPAKRMFSSNEELSAAIQEKARQYKGKKCPCDKDDEWWFEKYP